MLKHDLSLTSQDIDLIKSEILKDIEHAFKFAESSPFPTIEHATAGVYAN